VSFKIIPGDCLEVLKTLPAESVHTCITSPPYWGLRDYGVEGQIGLEATPELFVSKMVEVFREVKRVLRDDGTLWLNLGDSYSGSGKGCMGDGTPSDRGDAKQGTNRGTTVGIFPKVESSFKPKDLCGIPWLVAFALRADGWYLRSDIIWHKPNPMPESVTDRPTKSHEYIFLLTKSPRYYYDAEAVKEPIAESTVRIHSSDGVNARGTGADWKQYHVGNGHSGLVNGNLRDGQRNKRSVWTVATAPFSGAHFATFPPKLIEPCILAGTSEYGACTCGAPWERVVERTPAEVLSKASEYGYGAGRNDGGRSGLVGAESKTLGWVPTCTCGTESGIELADIKKQPCTVLDPFAGAGTTGLVARRLGRSFIGIELNPEYLNMAENRIVDDSPLFNRLPVEPSSLTIPDALRSQGESK
jgi:DNA modification methylase